MLSGTFQVASFLPSRKLETNGNVRKPGNFCVNLLMYAQYFCFFWSTTSCHSRNPAFLVIHVHYSHHCHGCRYAFLSQWYAKRIVDFFVSYPGSKLYLNSADENDTPRTTYEQIPLLLPGSSSRPGKQY
jgi:hypothetical protein